MTRETTKAGSDAARTTGRNGGIRSGLSAKAKKKPMLAEKYYKQEKLD